MIEVLVVAVLVLGITQVLTAILNHDERKRLINAVLAKHAQEYTLLQHTDDPPRKPQMAPDQAPRRPMGI